MKILQIANYKNGVGGISIQVKLIRDYLVTEGFTCDILSTKGTLSQRITAIARLLLNGNRYEVFHIHACSDRGFFPAVVGISIGRLLKKRLVLSFHGGGAEPFFRHHTKLVKFFLSKTDANIVLSGFIGSIYEKYNLPYTIIPNIIELKEGFFRERAEISPRFINIRSFHEIYNTECTLRAFQRVQGFYPDASLTLLGDGPLRSHLESFVKEKKIQNVAFVGQVRNDDIYHYLSQCDIMLSSSRFDNMPVSILEGFNAGLLVISSNVGGVPYMIRDGENGLLFDSENDQQLVEKMLYALNHPKEVRSMILEARRSLNRYSWDYCRPKLMKLYFGE